MSLQFPSNKAVGRISAAAVLHSIRTRRNAEYGVAEVRVSDSGKGIQKDKRDHA